MGMARSRNGAAKWTAVVLSGVLLVGGATAAHTRALARIDNNAEQIEELKKMAGSVRLIEHAVMKIAAHNKIDVKLD